LLSLFSPLGLDYYRIGIDVSAAEAVIDRAEEKVGATGCSSRSLPSSSGCRGPWLTGIIGPGDGMIIVAFSGAAKRRLHLVILPDRRSILLHFYFQQRTSGFGMSLLRSLPVHYY
jgi:hypothetical protein